jgi:hypothetical protein
MRNLPRNPEKGGILACEKIVMVKQRAIRGYCLRRDRVLRLVNKKEPCGEIKDKRTQRKGILRDKYIKR